VSDNTQKWQIIQNGENLTLISPTGDRTEAHFYDEHSIVVPAWNTYATFSYTTAKAGVPLYIQWPSGAAWGYCED